MSDKSAIEWTDSTWNPVTGCTKISPGCKHCYAETLAERFRGVAGHPYEQGFDLKLWPDRLELPLRWRKPRLIFVNSMSDLFHEDVPDQFVDRVFATMMEANWHTYQVLTKRPARMAAYVKRKNEEGWRLVDEHPHIWLGTSVESQDYLWRAECLNGLPVAVRFLSCEPLLGALSLATVLPHLEWVIVGGESGRGARPMEPRWVREIRDDCIAANVPFFFKQWGGVRKSKTGRELDGCTWDELPRVGFVKSA